MRPRPPSRASSSSEFEACLSRFRPESELCALNADPRAVVPASPLLRDAVAAGVEAAGRTGGLVDPTLVDEIEDAGYVGLPRGHRRRRRCARRCCSRPAAPAGRPESRRGSWAPIAVDEESGVIRRPPGVRFDSGGIGKGLAADLLAERLCRPSALRRSTAAAISASAAAEPRRLRGPRRAPADRRARPRASTIERGAVATSGLNVRVWRRDDGRYAHHLLDPSTRRAGLDRPGRRDRAGADRRRGRDALEGGPALGPDRRARRSSPSTAA